MRGESADQEGLTNSEETEEDIIRGDCSGNRGVTADDKADNESDGTAQNGGCVQNLTLVISKELIDVLGVKGSIDKKGGNDKLDTEDSVNLFDESKSRIITDFVLGVAVVFVVLVHDEIA